MYFVADNPIRLEMMPVQVLEMMDILVAEAKKHAHQPALQLDYTLGLISSGRKPKESGKQIEMMDILIDAGAAPGSGFAAFAHGNLEAARHLIDRGGEYTLVAAACFGDTGKAMELKSTASRTDFITALTAAAFYGHANMLSLLLEGNKDPNGYPENGFHTHATPLHQAVYSGNLECVRLLVNAGADLNATDKAYNGTPLGWSRYLQTEEGAEKKKEQYRAIEHYLSHPSKK